MKRILMSEIHYTQWALEAGGNPGVALEPRSMKEQKMERLQALE